MALGILSSSFRVTVNKIFLGHSAIKVHYIIDIVMTWRASDGGFLCRNNQELDLEVGEKNGAWEGTFVEAYVIFPCMLPHLISLHLVTSVLVSVWQTSK